MFKVGSFRLISLHHYICQSPSCMFIAWTSYLIF
jgi:hypothetical protein